MSSIKKSPAASATRRRIVAGAGALAACAAGVANAADEAFPKRTVRLIVPFPPGGPADIIARSLADPLSKRWGKPVIIENRGGASGTIGTALAAQAAPDGHTLLLTAASHVSNPPMFRKLPFDPVADFTPVSRMTINTMFLAVHPSTGLSSVADVVARLKKEPRSITIGSSGVGSVPHLAALLFGQRAGIEFNHIPYSGTSETSRAILSGEIQSIFQGPLLYDQVRAGKLRALATASGTRIPQIPDVPTFEEVGYPGFRLEMWYGVLGPAGLPADIVTKIDRDVRASVNEAAVVRTLNGLGISVDEMGPEKFAATMKQELSQWTSVIRQAGITLD